MELVYKDLTERIIGLDFETFNSLGSGLAEKQYQQGLVELFKRENIPFRQEVKLGLYVGEKKIAQSIFDFFVDEKFVLELKVGPRFYKTHFDQLYAYLKSSGIKLGLLILFTKRGVRIKRVVNLYP